MTTAPADEEHAAPFRMKPHGPFILRDYSRDDPTALTELRGLLEQILTRHKDLVPGQLHRSVIQWHADLHRAVEAAGTPGNGDDPVTAYTAYVQETLDAPTPQKESQ